MTNSNKSVFIDRNTSHIKHGWQEKRMIMEYNACVSCALIGHNVPTVLQIDVESCIYNNKQTTSHDLHSPMCAMYLMIHMYSCSVNPMAL